MPVNHQILNGDRRNFLWQAGGGLGGVALAALLADERLATADPPASSSAHGGLHHRPRVKRVVQLFMNGGVSQMDTFDYKPELSRRHGEKIDFGLQTAVTSSPGAMMKSLRLRPGGSDRRRSGISPAPAS